MKNFKFILGHSASTPTTLTLDHSPAGWDEKTLTFVRNETYHSVMRSYSMSLRFVREARDYIFSAYNTSGINALITIEVKALDRSDFTYSTYYTGILDLSKLVITDIYAECPIIDSDRMSKFKSRDDVDINLTSLRTLDGSTITDFSNNLYKTLYIEAVDYKENLLTTFNTIDVDVSTFTNEEIPAVTVYEEIEWDATDNRYENSSGTSESIEYNAKCTINHDLTIPVGASITMDVKLDVNGTQYTIARILNLTIVAGADSFTDSINGTIALPNAGYIGEIELTVSITGAVTGTCNVSDSELLITKTTSGVTTSQVQAILPDEAFQRSIRLMTGDTSFRSSLIGRTDSENYTYASDGDLSLIAVLNGYNIRSYPQELKSFTTSFKDLFKAFYSVKPIGFWYNHADSRWELNDITDFYKNSEILDLGEVSELEISIDENYYHNKILYGFNESVKYESVNGNQNFAVKTEYANDVQRINNIYDISTNYRTDDYGIEILRSNYWTQTYTEDVDGDENNFMIYAQRYSGAFRTVQGTDDFTTITSKIPGTQTLFYDLGTRLNLDFSPKRCMMRHAQMLAIPMHITQGNVTFLSSQFNFDLGLQKSGEAAVIYESDAIDTSDYEPLYYPELYNFKCKVTKAIIDQLLSDPHGYITFTYQGTTYKGHLIEASTEPYNRNGNFTLIKYNPNR